MPEGGSFTAGAVIVGAGHAGVSLAAFLRQYGYRAPVTLIGDEPTFPYHRPPLSKAYLLSSVDQSSLWLKPTRYYAQQAIDLRRGASVVEIDRDRECVVLDGGTVVNYESLIIATGANARRLSFGGAGHERVFYLRTIADADRLRSLVRSGLRLVVIGGGYIGLEIAASARMRGAEVTIVERESRVLARVASAALSRFFQEFHASKGVQVLLNTQIEAIGPSPTTSDIEIRVGGGVIACDAVVVGVGAVPNDQLARDALLLCRDGIAVDAAFRSSDPSIFAIGDVARHPSVFYGRQLRLESIANATEQARRVACGLTGRAPPPPEIPWFWSDQYGLKLQIAGLLVDVDESIVRGDPATAKFSIFHLSHGVPVAVEAVNAPQAFVAGKALIAGRCAVSRDELANSSVPLRSRL